MKGCSVGKLGQVKQQHQYILPTTPKIRGIKMGKWFLLLYCDVAKKRKLHGSNLLGPWNFHEAATTTSKRATAHISF